MIGGASSTKEMRRFFGFVFGFECVAKLKIMDNELYSIVDEQDARALAHEQKVRVELTAKVERLEELAREQERIADEMERLAQQSRLIRAESEQLLAA